MVELTPVPFFLLAFTSWPGVIFPILLGGLLITLLVLTKKTPDELAFSFTVVVFFIVLCFGTAWATTESINVTGEENISNIENAYGVDFGSRNPQTVIPQEGDYIVLENIRSSSSSTLLNQVMVENNDGFITLFVPESEGSTEFVELPLSD